MKSNAQILQDILATARTTLLNDSDMGYTMPDGKYHIYIYADQDAHWDNSPADTFYVVEPNKVVNGAHEPMGDTFLTSSRELSEVLIGCQWCMEWFDRDRMMEASREAALPDELVVRLAHEAGWIEGQGKIVLNSWEDLQIAIRDAIQEYYDNPNELNPFSIEEIIERILKERFPSEPEPLKAAYKEFCILTCSAEHDYGINVYGSVHKSSSEALKHAEELRKIENMDDMYWNYNIDTQVIDVSQFPDPSPEKVAACILQAAQAIKEKQSLDHLIHAADNKRCRNENDQSGKSINRTAERDHF